MPSIKALGIDLAKLVFSIHGVDKHSKCKLRKTGYSPTTVRVEYTLFVYILC
jgi:hypothetical protein